MTTKSLGNPYSERSDLRHGADCGCESCKAPVTDHVHDRRHMNSDEMLERAKRVFTCDPGLGVARHADAGMEAAIEFGKRHGVKMPMID